MKDRLDIFIHSEPPDPMVRRELRVIANLLRVLVTQGAETQGLLKAWFALWKRPDTIARVDFTLE